MSLHYTLSDAFPRAPHTSGKWLEYFEKNAESLLPICWEQGVHFTAQERDAVAKSLQEFQLGESSEGRHLIRRGQEHAEQIGDPDYLRALRRFIGEEHRHARELGRVMALAGIAHIGSTWPDTVFRWLRRGAGLEWSIVVLITAEIIARVYYAAMRRATGSTILRRLCDQILRDEIQHIRFQAERVAILRRNRQRSGLALSAAAHRLLLAGTCVIVWRKHGRAMRQGGYRFASFWRDTWLEMADAQRRMDPNSYRFAEEAIIASHAAAMPAAGLNAQ